MILNWKQITERTSSLITSLVPGKGRVIVFDNLDMVEK